MNAPHVGQVRTWTGDAAFGRYTLVEQVSADRWIAEEGGRQFEIRLLPNPIASCSACGWR